MEDNVPDETDISAAVRGLQGEIARGNLGMQVEDLNILNREVTQNKQLVRH